MLAFRSPVLTKYSMLPLSPTTLLAEWNLITLVNVVIKMLSVETRDKIFEADCFATRYRARQAGRQAGYRVEQMMVQRAVAE